MASKRKLFVLTSEIISEFQEKIGFTFLNINLLKEALTHKSFMNEAGRNLKYNERLEFLGDSVLTLIITDYLFKQYPFVDEGKLAQIRGVLISDKTLSSIASKLNLGKYLQLGHGEESSGGRSRKSLLENTFEALVGAMYLDRGVKAARDFVLSSFSETFKKIENNELYKDYKTILQEEVQKIYKETPIYKGIKKDENIFHVAVYVQGKICAEGIGKSKKEAEQDAAEKAIKQIK